MTCFCCNEFLLDIAYQKLLYVYFGRTIKLHLFRKKKYTFFFKYISSFVYHQHPCVRFFLPPLYLRKHYLISKCDQLLRNYLASLFGISKSTVSKTILLEIEYLFKKLAISSRNYRRSTDLIRNLTSPIKLNAYAK